jgi:hypothetical protein
VAKIQFSSEVRRAKFNTCNGILTFSLNFVELLASPGRRGKKARAPIAGVRAFPDQANATIISPPFPPKGPAEAKFS